MKFVRYYPNTIGSFFHKLLHGRHYYVLYWCEYPLAVCLKCDSEAKKLYDEWQNEQKEKKLFMHDKNGSESKYNMNREIKFRVWKSIENEYEEMDYDFCGYTEKGFLRIPNVDSKYIMQYTCLKDKNGKEIYEGDILKTRYSALGVIIFKEGEFCLKLPEWCERTSLLDNKEWLEVIGNIYENRELIK